MTRSRVDFPPPLGPSRVVVRPGATDTDTASRTRTGPNDFDTPRKSIIGPPGRAHRPEQDRRCSRGLCVGGLFPLRQHRGPRARLAGCAERRQLVLRELDRRALGLGRSPRRLPAPGHADGHEQYEETEPRHGGLLLVGSDHQLEPSVSPPFGVSTAHQVSPDTPAATVRTLPSPIATRIVPVCRACVIIGLQSGENARGGIVWNRDAGPTTPVMEAEAVYGVSPSRDP